MAMILTIKEAATAFSLSEYAIRQGIRQGKFPAYQLNGSGGKYLIDRESFADALKDLCNSNIRQGISQQNSEFGGGFDVNTKIRRIQG